jgi:hypothetical protein
MEVKILALFLALAAIGLLVAFGIRASRSAQSRRKPSAGGFAWALLFLSSGRMPPPPPQSQIEQEAEERKNRGIDRGKGT